MSAALPDYELAGDLKFGQVGIANLRLRRLDIEQLAAEMADRVQRAPKLFANAAVVLDFSALASCPDASQASLLIEALRSAGVRPVALAYGTSAADALAQQLGIPVLAKFRASYERDGEAAEVAAPVSRAVAPEPVVVAQPPAKAEPGMIHPLPVRSGQQVYAHDRDLTVCAMVGAGAEVIADGSIHIYGALRGRALAGAGGLTTARIFCREFHAELVAIAGHYKVLEEIPKALLGKAVQIRLQDEKLLIEELA